MNKALKEILSYVFIIIIVLLIKWFIATPINVVGESMIPTLKDGDMIVIKVTSEDKSVTQDYRIKILKNDSNLEEDDDEQDEIVEEEKEDNSFMIALIVFFIGLLVFIIALIYKMTRKNNNSQKM